MKASVGLNNLISTDAKAYTALNLDRIRYVTLREEILFKNPVLYNSPIVRNGKLATVGYQPEVWQRWE